MQEHGASVQSIKKGPETSCSKGLHKYQIAVEGLEQSAFSGLKTAIFELGYVKNDVNDADLVEIAGLLGQTLTRDQCFMLSSHLKDICEISE